MADVFTAAKRSEVMSKIRGSGNRSTELRAVTLFRKGKVRGWRRGLPLPGKPDFAFPAQKLAVFIDGCFWHGCPRHFRAPASNADFWRDKIARNSKRDREVGRLLRAKGWKVIRIWEHDLRGEPSRSRALARILRVK
jgi:DNA mismatch endonuclease (patch repair protein)